MESPLVLGSRVRSDVVESMRPTPVASTASAAPGSIFTLRDVGVDYRGAPAVAGVSLDIAPSEITAIIGPSGCGKSSLLRCLNRMNDLIPGAEVSGAVEYQGIDLYGPRIDPVEVRRRIGMVFQKPNPFPKSIYENVAAGLRVRGIKSRAVIDEAVESALRRAAIWDEVSPPLR